MKKCIAPLLKMSSCLQNPIEYYLRINNEKILLNRLMNQSITLSFTGEIYCIQCGRKTARSFQQGYCYVCMQRLAECNFCVIHPEKCRIGQEICPENDWAHVQCGQPHYVYLANSSGLKVGITRCTQVPFRWIDQGASQGMLIFQTKNRYQAGVIEVCIKQFVNDRTNWRKMLQQRPDSLDLKLAYENLMLQAKDKIEAVTAEFSDDIVWLSTFQMTELEYPINQYPSKIFSFSFDKNPIVSGILQGIKGQYLLLDSGVINLRKFSGYQIEYLL